MIHKGEFIKGTFVERPNRFLTLVQMDGRREYAHLPNPGRIKELLILGVSVIVNIILILMVIR